MAGGGARHVSTRPRLHASKPPGRAGTDWSMVGIVAPISFARTEKGLLAQIAQHEQRAADAGVPPVLRGRIGPAAVAAWAELDDELAVKREIIRTVADIKLLPAAYKGERRPFGRHRLDWRWRFGPGTGKPAGDPEPAARAA